MTDRKPSAVLTSTSGSGNVLHIVDDGDGVIFFDAWNGKQGIGVHTTPEALTAALRRVGLGVTTLQEAEDLRARVEEVERAAQDDIKKLVAVAAAVTEHEESEDEECDDFIARLQAILHPAPPYTFPTKYGAVIRAKAGRQVTQFQLVEDSGTKSWVSHRGDWLIESQIRAAFTDFETITEGIDE